MLPCDLRFSRPLICQQETHDKNIIGLTGCPELIGTSAGSLSETLRRTIFIAKTAADATTNQPYTVAAFRQPPRMTTLRVRFAF